MIGVPGPWADRDAVVEAIPNRNMSGEGPQYVLSGPTLVETGSAEQLTLEVTGRDPRMRAAFEAAGLGSGLTEEDLAAVEEHRHVLYLVDDDGGSLEAARRLMRFARALLLAGGAGVKVESAGKAFSPQEWFALCADPEHEGLLHRAFVALVAEGGDVLSCGMHNLGWPDAIVAEEESAELIELFNIYCLVDGPGFADGHTFRASQDAPRYVLQHEPDRYAPDPDDPFHNPWGRWRLVQQD